MGTPHLSYMATTHYTSSLSIVEDQVKEISQQSDSTHQSRSTATVIAFVRSKQGKIRSLQRAAERDCFARQACRVGQQERGFCLAGCHPTSPSWLLPQQKGLVMQFVCVMIGPWPPPPRCASVALSSIPPMP